MRTKPFSIEISDDAENDLDNSFSYYFNENPQVAKTFIKYIKIGLENVKKTPFSYPVMYKSLRKYTVKKFPFVIYYRIEELKIIVFAIFHTSRNPEIWNARIEK